MTACSSVVTIQYEIPTMMMTNAANNSSHILITVVEIP